MTCPKCGSENINITLEQTKSKTRTKRTGCLWELGRLFLIICTCGLWLIIGKRKETSKTKFKNKKIAICQNCGHKWKV